MEETINLAFVKEEIFNFNSTYIQLKNLVFLKSLWFLSLIDNNAGWTHAEWIKCNKFRISQKTEFENQIIDRYSPVILNLKYQDYS